jgi:hypothetical protein
MDGGGRVEGAGVLVWEGLEGVGGRGVCVRTAGEPSDRVFVGGVVLGG